MRQVLLTISVLFGLLLSGCVGIPPFHLCVAEGQRVSTLDGQRPIEDLSIGDQVLSVDDQGNVRSSRVVAKQAHEAAKFDRVRTKGDRELWATGEHPIWTPNDWKRVRDINLGELVRTPEGTDVVTSITRNAGASRVFDVTVEPHANFFAGDLLVHNKSMAPPLGWNRLVGTWISTGGGWVISITEDRRVFLSTMHRNLGPATVPANLAELRSDRGRDKNASGVPLKLRFPAPRTGSAMGFDLGFDGERLKGKFWVDPSDQRNEIEFSRFDDLQRTVESVRPTIEQAKANAAGTDVGKGTGGPK